MSQDRGQAHALEAFIAALLLVTGLIFAIQSTAVTPLSASTSNQRIETTQRMLAFDVLAIASANGELHEAVLSWNTSSEQFRNAGSDGTFVRGGPPNGFGKRLNQTFGGAGSAFNVYVRYQKPNGEYGSRQLVYMGSPSNHAISATRMVVIFDSDTLPNGKTVTEAAANDSIYMQDIAPNSEVFNVVE
ncbi:MAG: hypothetical protein ABEI52_10825, partial [Halobacteriaceae archaeon]